MSERIAMAPPTPQEKFEQFLDRRGINCFVDELPKPWPPKVTPDELVLFARLESCTDPLPRSYRRLLRLPKGATYADAVDFLVEDREAELLNGWTEEEIQANRALINYLFSANL